MNNNNQGIVYLKASLTLIQFHPLIVIFILIPIALIQS